MKSEKRGGNGISRDRLRVPTYPENRIVHAKRSTNGGPNKAGVDAVGIARGYLEMGIAPVPLQPGSKKPKGGEGWNTLQVEPETLEQFFTRGDNVGGLWGKPSGWIIDIDLDCDEAMTAARTLLPETFIYGRRQAPGSHYLFISEGIATRKYASKGVGTLVEIRSTGTQSVLPPSRHPSGDLYQIDHDVAIARMPRARLEQQVRLIAAAALAAHHYPEEGARHDYVLTIAGALLWNGWEDGKVREFMHAVLEAAKAKEGAQADRDYTVENAIKNFRAGNRIPGWPTLSQSIPGEDLKLLRDWLGWKKTADNAEPPPDRISPLKIEKVPPKLLETSGLVSEVYAWAAKRAFSDQPVFALATALMTVALASGNKYLVSAWDTPLQPYFLLLAPTASGKESAMESVFEAARRIGFGNLVFQGFQSYHAMLDKLANPPNTAIWLWDEAARKLKTAGRSQGGQDYQILTYLLSLYGKSASYVPGFPGRKQSIEPLKHPFFSVLAAAQPNQLIEAITDSDVSLGLINRFILLDAGEAAAPSNAMRTNVFPSRLEKALGEFQRISRPAGADSFIRIAFGPGEAYRIYSDFNEHCREQVTRGGQEIWGRANQNALICAGIMAIGINPRNPIITAKVAQWSTDLMLWSVEQWKKRIEESSSRSAIEGWSKYVCSIIARVHSLRERCGNRASELALVDRGLMPRSLLIRMARHLRGKDLDDVISQLLVSDVIGASEEGGYDVYWIKDASPQPPETA